MNAFKPDGSPIEVVVTGEREIYWVATGERWAGNYLNLSDEDSRSFDEVCDDLYDMPMYSTGKIRAMRGAFLAMAAAHPADGIPYFCDSCGHKFLELPENEWFCSCPACGDRPIYPDTDEGRDASVRAQIAEEDKTEGWMADQDEM